jgi:crotonobetainyl-CoA:carnitine CoA-transferase CaiB-like acyl-CoA transferase
MDQQTGPLEGIRVVEMSHMIMGPSCGQFLGFLGAEVIKIEPPEGDKTRNLTGMGAGFFPAFNRGKKSVTLDLKIESGLKALHALLSTADVFVENFRDETLAKMALDPETLRSRYPSLITASCKGFLHGPYEKRAAMDEVVQMMTGMAYMTGPSGRPLRIGSSANDIMGGLFAAFSVLAALIGRGKTGQGAAIRSGLFENCLLLVAQHMVQFDIEGTESPPMPERVFSWPVYDLFTSRDGRQIFVGAATDGQWAKLCQALDLEHLLQDPGLQTRPDQIAARNRTLPLIAERVAARDFEDLLTLFDHHALLYAPVARPAEMYDDPHVNRPGGLIASEYPGKRAFRAPGLPVEIDGRSPIGPNTDIPEIGAHTQDILAELGIKLAAAE